MSKDEIRKAIKEKRVAKKVTIAEVAKVVGKNPTFVAAALNGNHKFTADEAKKVGDLICLLYTSDAADERSSVDLGGRRIIKNKTRDNHGGERTSTT